MQNISPICLKRRNECTNEMVLGDNSEYFSQNIDLLTKYKIFITFFAYDLILGLDKHMILKGLPQNRIYNKDTDISFI